MTHMTGKPPNHPPRRAAEDGLRLWLSQPRQPGRQSLARAESSPDRAVLDDYRQAEGQARHLPVHEWRPVAGRHLRLQASA